LLINDVAREFGGRVTVVTEEYGNSEMATRYGVRRYPVVFVDDVLVARPKDFGFTGPEDVGKGLYVPWREQANQERFKVDLRSIVELRLKGERVAGLDLGEVTRAMDPADGPPTLPASPMTDASGAVIDPASLAGRVVVVEMWATWCPPCQSTLGWLDAVQKRHPDGLTVIAIAVDSKLADVNAMIADRKPSYRVVMATEPMLETFGGVAAVPKLFVFDKAGRRTHVFYGAPPDLHERIEQALRKAGI
jgi:thiol-disulfide isomerase/thioredoxin